MAHKMVSHTIRPWSNSALTSFKPILKAYGFAYIYVIAPKLLNFFILLGVHNDRGNRNVLLSLYRILLQPLAPEKFPAFCGLLVGLYASLQIPSRIIFHYVASLKTKNKFSSNPALCVTLTRPVAAFCAAWLSLQFLNKSQRIRISLWPSNLRRETDSGNISGHDDHGQFEEKKLQHAPQYSAGKTLDLTLFALTRSIETIIGDLWSRHKASRRAKAKWTSLETMISRFADSFVFALSSGMIMWAWFYFPDSLPRAYNRWIRGVAQVDRRLVEVLRRARKGDFVYGRDTGQAPLLESMCKEYNWPLTWGDPAQTVPIPCELVHSGFGPSCHWHAVMRFLGAFKIALATSLPLQILMKARRLSWKAFERALRDALRSAAFLGSFVGLFYYGVCLSRTCLGPKLLRPDKITPMKWDQGLCIRAGCMLCGWSILIEAAKRRQEIASFVAPKALATILPRRYDKKYLWREQAAFSFSIAVLFTFIHYHPARVRGMLGRLLHKVLA